MSAEKQLTSADLDALCDRFEQACKRGDIPPIEEYLAELSAADYEEVFRELLYIEHQHRIRAGDVLAEEQYHQRFPKFTHIVDEVLSHGLGHNCDTLLHAADDQTARNHFAQQEDATFDSLLEALPAGDDDGIGPTLGDYELLDELGRGGMGIVFRARQKSVDRLVALKVLRRDKLSELPDEDQALMIERFRTESHSAAQLEHDHIVPVYEVGESDGIYFYSMRYVQGESLAELITEHPLDNHSAAQAIEPIARALEAAHRRGVLHRDIKPRNIMVDDATGRPLLTDFGLAKLLEAQQEMTHTGDVMGSPPYMSPEQATDAAHVTASADIYSLGATLYHTLTGRAPFQAATMAETLRQVWFEEPPAPCSLNPAIDRDLETICLKCLEKEPSRRFESAGEMAAELGRYLRGEPILSRPLGTLGQLQRWRRRNPAIANLAATIVTLIILIFIVNIYYTIQLRRSLNEATVRLGWAVSAVDEMTDIATKEDGLKAHGVDEVRREMLSASRQYYDRFVERETDDPVLETERGKAYGRLANIEADLGNPDESVRLYIQAVDVFAGLEKRHADNPQYTYLRGAYLANLAGLYRDSGQLELAESTLTDAYKLASGLHEQDSASIEYAALLGQIHNERGVVYMDLGEVDQAEKARLETVNLWQQIVEVDDENEHRHQLATSHNNLAEFYRTNRQPTSATKHFELAQSIWQDLAQANPLISDYAAGLALCEYSLGVMQLDEGNLEQAETLLMSAEGRRRRLAEKHNQLPQYRDDLAASLDSMGRLLHARNDYEAAASDYRMALAIREELRNKFPDVPKYEIAYAASQMNLGYLYKDDRRYAEAANYFRIAIDVLNRVVAENPETVAYHEHLAGANYNLAIVLSLEGELNEAKKYCHAAIQIQQQIGAATSGDGSAEMGLAGCYDLLALIQEDQGEAAAAAVTYEKLITLLQDARTGDVMAIARAHLQLAAMRATLAEFTAAETALTKAIEQLRAVGPTSATDDSIAQMLRIAHSARAEIYDELGKHKLAVEEWDEVVRDDPQPLYQLRRAVSLARSGDHAAAAASLNEVKALEPSDTEPTLLLNAACVLSRAAEAAEADTSLDDQQRDDSVQKLLNEGTAYLQRCLVPEDPRYAALVEYVRSDRDLARLRKYEEVQKLLDETSTDPEAE